MANPDRPNGFVFVKWINGSTRYPDPIEYPLAATNEPLAKGDLVSLTAAGSVDRTCTDGGGDHQEDTVVGVCESILYKNSSGELVESTYVAAAQGDDTDTLGSGTGAIVRVLPADPAIVWSVQCDDGGATAISQDLVGNAANPLALEATDPTQQGKSGHSIMELDTSTAGTGADLFAIIGLHKKPGRVFSSTEADSRFGRVLVTFKEPLFGTTPTVAGI